MKSFLRWLDPYKQSCFYFKWTFWSVFFFVLTVFLLCVYAHGKFADTVLNNIFVYLPNYLTHEFSHRFWGALRWEWWTYASGNGMETLIPLTLCIGALRLRGGRFFEPFLLYWLSTTLYGAGIYAADARAMKLPLTSSDMMSNFAPGQVKGDWWYILKPRGLLEYDVFIGHILIDAAMVVLALAVFSLWYYVTHMEQYIRAENAMHNY